MTYSEKLKDPRWQRKRLEILERDNFTCRDCQATDKHLHVHHCHYEKDPWDASNDVLLTLCEDCHERRGKVEGGAKLALARIMAHLPHEPGNQEDLLQFVEGLLRVADAMDEEPDAVSPLVVDETDWDWHTDARWFRYALENPEARPCYDEVSGRTAYWAKYDQSVKDREMAKWIPAG